MKFRDFLSKALPYIVAIVVFWVVSALYFAPQFEDKTLSMTDVTMYGGMKQDISEHRAEYGEDPQWTGGMFGGMPAYLITVQYPAMVLRNSVQWLVGLMGEPVALMFLAMTGFWLMLLMAGVNPWVAIAASLAYGLSTYNILIIEAGHITKMRAMGYAPMLVGAVLWTFRRNIWIGGALAALFGTLTIAASHHQITYYFLLTVLACWINELVVTIGRKNWIRFWSATGMLGLAAAFAVGANFTHIWYTFEHTPETTRGGSEVATAGAADKSTAAVESRGLDLEYATAWSYGVGESLNMFIPDFRGGGSSGGFAPDGKVADVLRSSGYDPSAATQLPGYWGGQSWTGGPTYIGAVVMFLFVLGMFLLPARQKWWILAVSILGLLLAWGRNAMWFTEFAFDVFPGYNKFRTVAMALAILQWSVPFTAALVMSGLWNGEFKEAAKDSTKNSDERQKFTRAMLWSMGLTGGVALLFALLGSGIYDFAAASDGQFSGVPGLVEAMRSERAAMFRTDCWRSVIFVLLTAGVVWAWAGGIKGLRKWIPVTALSVLVLCDLVPVDLRYVSHEDFVMRTRTEVTPDEADKQIMEDAEPGFRVFNISGNPFNEAYTSYFHRSIGGYHAAKLRRYQDIIDRYLSGAAGGDRAAGEVLNILNTKYYIVADENGRRAIQNPETNGAAWFVSDVFTVDGASAELEALATIDNKHEAVVDRRFGSMVEGAGVDSAAVVELVEYRPNYLRYEASTANEQVAVFSEIYYDKGWKAYIDGEEAPYFRADYILRGMVVPAGDHVIEWRFRAPRFALVEGITLGCSIIILLWLAAAIILNRKQLWHTKTSD